MKLSVIIPVFNEAKTIKEIVKRVASVQVNKEIIIVDDFSQDGTRDVLKSIEKENIKVLYHEENKGKGAAIRTGIAAVTGDYVIIQDADLEYNPEEYRKLLAVVQKEKAPVIYGSRFSGRRKSMSISHTLGNKFLTFATNLLYGSSVTDMETCYKLIKCDLLKSLNIKANRFDFEPEVTAKILKRGIKIVEVPISYKGRKWLEGKKITWRDGFAALWTLLKYRFIN